MVKHIFVGIDLGDKNSVARIAVDREKSERLSFVNRRAGRARLFEELRRRAEKAGGATVIIAYEASACGFILCDEARAMGMRCEVLAPTKMEKSVEQRRHKTDDKDADDVIEKLRGHVLAGNRLPTVWIPDQQTRDDREVLRIRLDLTEKQTQLKAQVQMLLKRCGLEKPEGLGAGWTKPYRQWLRGLSESESVGWGARQGLSSLLRQLQSIESELECIQEAVKQLAAETRHKPFVDELTQERGVGLLTALGYRLEIGYAGRFRRSRQVGKFVGLTPSSYESGQQQDRKGHISRQGPPRLRRLLCQASWVHVCHDAGAKRTYQQLVARNSKKKKIALVAMMRRLVVRLWHRMRKVELQITAAAA
jgi:transposase